jgi:hypothetical protein
MLLWSFRRVALVVACVVCASGPALAQTEKITISVAPRPNQSIHYVVTEEFSIAGGAEGGTKENRPQRSRTTLTGKGTTAYTLVTPAQAGTDRITSQLTYDESTAEISFDDAPPQKETAKGIVGSTFTIVFGADGDVIEVTGPDAEKSTIDSVKRTIAEMYKYFPTVSMSVGETMTLPPSRAVPATLLPIGPVDIEGRMTMTLVSVEVDGTDRIAHCEQTYELTVVEHPAQTVWRENRMNVRGSRKAQIDLKRGIVKASQMETTYDNVNTPRTDEMPTFKSHGVMKATVTGKP